MMFQKKEKVPQYLGNSFKDFNENYQNLTKNLSTKFKHTSMENIDSINMNPTQKPNGGTWDSKHLDSFVATSPWATSSIYFDKNIQSQGGNRQFSSLSSYANNNQKNNNQGNDSQMRIEKGSNQNQQQNKANGQMKNNSTLNQADKKNQNTNIRESFFFSTVSRFVDDNNYKKIAYPDRYSDKNFLVCDRQDNDPKYYDKHFSVNRHTDNNSMKLSMCFQPVQLMTPAQKLDQLLELKGDQKNFQGWKNEYAKMNKKYRVHKGMYPSGILQVDNPHNFGSQLYSEEAKKEHLKQARQMRFKELHRDRISHIERTNPQIEFLNNYSQKVFPSKVYSDEVKRPEINNSAYKFQHQYDKMQEGLNSSQVFNQSQRERLSPNWSSKRPVTTNLISQGRDTSDRLFGAEAKNYSLSRASYLREQETKNRNFNVISFVDNKIEFKQDKGVKNIEQK